MTKRNRVTPFGAIVSAPARGTMMGNRGCLHDSHGNVTKSSARTAWVTCLLQFKGRQRRVMTPGQYTELFFLDEATALAAGHRPCATCQRARYEEFKGLWIRANPGSGSEIHEIDQHLQRERLASGGSAWPSAVGDLVNGAFVIESANPKTALLYYRGTLYPWTSHGYGPPMDIRPSDQVTVITPRSVFQTIAAGFKPRLHATAGHWLAAERSTLVMEGRAVLPPGKPRRSVAEPRPPLRETAPGGVKNLYKPPSTPSGRDLFTYFAAILEVTGMDRGASFPLKKFMKNFSGHVTAGRIERTEEGFRLTAAGRSYFSDRLSPQNPQRISRVEVDMWVGKIKNGAPGWIAV